MNQHNTDVTTSQRANGNPFLRPWDTPFEAPPFQQIEPEHFRPAFDLGMTEQRSEIEAIAAPHLAALAETLHHG